MSLSQCPRCNRLFEPTHNRVCPRCQPMEDADYERVRDAIEASPNQSAEQVSESTGVDIGCVLRLLEDGRVKNVTSNNQVRCGRCGAPAISISKKLCEGCLQKLNSEVAQMQSKIKLPSKKNLNTGTALEVKNKLNQHRSG